MDAARYGEIVDQLVGALTAEPGWLLGPLCYRVQQLAAAQRYEEAAWVRDRHAALSKAMERRRAWHAMTVAGRIFADSQDATVCVDRGRFVAAWPTGSTPPLLPLGDVDTPGQWPVPPTSAVADEADLLWKWLTSGAVRLIEVDEPVSWPAAPLTPLIVAA